MKSVIMIIMTMVLGLTTPANAALVDNGGGLIYDTVLNITWYDTRPLESKIWSDAMAWAASLTAGGVTGWRLPHVLPVNGSTYNYTRSYDGSTDNGYNITSPNSELSHLFYVSLGNKGERKTDGSPEPVYGLANTGPFTSLVTGLPYWYSTDYSISDAAFYFNFENGHQNAYYKYVDITAMAVHDGNVGGPVPIPPALWLLGSGLIGLIGVRRFRK